MAKKQLNILATSSAHADLKVLAARLGLTQGETLRYLLDYYQESAAGDPGPFGIDRLLHLNR